MKRILPVVLALAILFPALLLPAAAAEPEEYVFEYIELPQTFSSFDFILDDDLVTFIYEGKLPEGSYYIKDYFITSDYGDVIYKTPGIYEVKYSYNSDFDSLGEVEIYQNLFPFDVYVDGNLFNSIKLDLYLIYSITYDFSLICMSSFSRFSVEPSRITLVPYEVQQELISFLDLLHSSLYDFSSFNLIKIFLVSLGIVISPVICWFGFRFVKAKVKKSFMKGKI